MGVASTVAAILAVGVLIIIHEAGHYLAAKWAGMSVSRFSVGFGPVIYRTANHGETEFVISAIPFGGYVAIDGMNPEDGTDQDDPRSYHSKSFGAKFGAIIAGPLANYILAFVLFFVYAAFFFVEQQPPVEVVAVSAESPAEGAGLKEGDLLIGTADGVFEDMSDLDEAISPGKPIAFLVQRDGVQQEITVEPRAVGGGHQIGIRFRGARTLTRPMGVVAGAQRAWEAVWVSTARAYAGLSGLVTGAVGLGAVDGPIGIVKQLSDSVQRSTAGTLSMVAGLSVALGFFNLLPLPALDGGRLLFLIVAAIRRKPIEARLEGLIHVAGFVLLLGLILVVSIADVFE